MPARFLVAATLALCLAAGCGGSQAAGRAADSEKPLTAYEIMAKYPPLTGHLAAMAEAGEIERIMASGGGEHRTWKTGKGHQQITVHECLIEGELWEVEVRGFNHFDPMADLPEDQIQSVRYGYSEEEFTDRFLTEEQREAAKGVVVDDPTEIHAVCQSLRRDSWHPYCQIACRSYQGADGRIDGMGHGRGAGFGGLGCSLGLYFRMKSGELVVMSGTATNGGFFGNQEILAVLQAIARKHGKTIKD